MADPRARSDRLGTVTSCEWWEQVSAAADGELDPAARTAALDHAHRCARCGPMLATLQPSETLTPRSPIDGASLTARERRWLKGRWERWLLMVVAVVIVADAVPTFIRGDGFSAEAHAVRHLASWQIGFGVAVFVAAWMSRLSHAMLAFAATFAALTITAKTIDVIAGHRGPWADSVHLVELVAVFLLWRITPTHLLPWARRHHTPAAAVEPPSSSRLRIVVADTDDENGPT